MAFRQHLDSAGEFLRFFTEIEQPSPSFEAFEVLARMFRAAETAYGAIKAGRGRRGSVALVASRRRRFLMPLRDEASIPRRRLETAERKLAIRVMKRSTPVSQLVSRATRETLRTYFRQGRLSTPIADRKVEDRFIDLSPDEQALYQAVDDYISTTYSRVSEKERNAVGFVMTIYRRRLASSFAALRNTLEDHLAVISGCQDLPADLESRRRCDRGCFTAEEEPDAEEAAAREREGLAVQERAEIEVLLANVRKAATRQQGRRTERRCSPSLRVRVTRRRWFSHNTRTRWILSARSWRAAVILRAICFSGRGGEVRDPDGTWRIVSRDDVKRRFREGKADVLLCTDAAAEGLNFQFCGALVNYDLPWNPMRVEQRIGRIDRLGQRHATVRIVNLHYRDTVESDVYVSLRKRINLFEQVVGRLQPILARLPSLISETVLLGQASDPESRENLTAKIEAEAKVAATSGFDLDAAIDEEFIEPARDRHPLSLEDFDLVIRTAEVLPPGIEVKTMGAREYSYLAPGMESIRVTTDAEYFEQHADSVELWSTGNPLFPPPNESAEAESCPAGASIRQILANR